MKTYILLRFLTCIGDESSFELLASLLLLLLLVKLNNLALLTSFLDLLFDVFLKNFDEESEFSDELDINSFLYIYKKITTIPYVIIPNYYKQSIRIKKINFI